MAVITKLHADASEEGEPAEGMALCLSDFCPIESESSEDTRVLIPHKLLADILRDPQEEQRLHDMNAGGSGSNEECMTEDDEDFNDGRRLRNLLIKSSVQPERGKVCIASPSFNIEASKSRCWAS